MSTQLTRQEQLFGEVDEHYGTVSIPNKDLWPFVRVVHSIVDECKLQSDGETFSVRAIDPANVGMVDVEFDPDTSIPWTETLGINMKYLSGRLQNKPRTSNNSVDVELDMALPYGSINVSEEVDGRTYHLSERLGLIDPHSIREEPDFPDLETDATVDLPVKRLYDFLRNKPQDNHLEFDSYGAQVRIGERGDTTDYTAALTFEEDVGEAEAMYSPDYLKSIFKGLNAVGIETVTAKWADEFPIRFFFEEGNLSGMFMLAPRIQA